MPHDPIQPSRLDDDVDAFEQTPHPQALHITGREKTPAEIERDNAAARRLPIEDDPTDADGAEGFEGHAKGLVSQVAEPLLAALSPLPIVGSLLRHPIVREGLGKLGVSTPAESGFPSPISSTGPAPAGSVGFIDSRSAAPSAAEAPRANAFSPVSEPPKGVHALLRNPKAWGALGAVLVLWWMFGGSASTPSGPKEAPNSLAAQSPNAPSNTSSTSAPMPTGNGGMLTGDTPLPGFQAPSTMVTAQGANAPAVKAAAAPAPTVAPASTAAPTVAPVNPAAAQAIAATTPTSPPPFFGSMTLSGSQAQQAAQAAQAVASPGASASPTAAPSGTAPAVPAAPNGAPENTAAPVAKAAQAPLPSPAASAAPASAPAPAAPAVAAPAVAPAASTSAPSAPAPSAAAAPAQASQAASPAIAKSTTHPAAPHQASTHPRVAAKPQAPSESQADRDAVRVLNSQLDQRLSGGQ
ncbi:hypothetical protein [Burkholderia pseudomallei]|uniref:hypothetical protein n=1 Tax=Burkholderia pseudomallei TaxID=28450 RepID=UPI000F083E56|nr:hypothetical protein [Burkholderia pseudomallei]CAJ3071964.1 Uncharacterised protein [Burkholderia pseudomallei]VCK72902.1 Uncharacterised protein [Burkholderia pseudomallei]VCK79965.1 Uncharacterised protein [Burkholderia pseudomallei]VCK80057.1 Uncharacterised protein [Burkholderia pseudomallei]VCK80811.1 Uncharacterised protein [Burkholderia pseudomallei]